jgi:hypothetical protein
MPFRAAEESKEMLNFMFIRQRPAKTKVIFPTELPKIDAIGETAEINQNGLSAQFNLKSNLDENFIKVAIEIRRFLQKTKSELDFFDH